MSGQQEALDELVLEDECLSPEVETEGDDAEESDAADAIAPAPPGGGRSTPMAATTAGSVMT